MKTIMLNIHIPDDMNPAGVVERIVEVLEDPEDVGSGYITVGSYVTH